MSLINLAFKEIGASEKNKLIIDTSSQYEESEKRIGKFIKENTKGLNKILKFGFLPTRMSDSFAIALGGAAFYRNTVNALMANGMSEADAKVEAMAQWQNAAEESQQSSDPSKISEIQSSSVGKVIYAFANTPFQYARIVKRKLQDVVSGRSAAEGGGSKVRQDLQSVLYYSIGQAMLFNALQTALFAVAFEDDEGEWTNRILPGESTMLFFEENIQTPYSDIENLKPEVKEHKRIKSNYVYLKNKVSTLLDSIPNKEDKIKKIIPALIDNIKPDFIFYLSGVDVLGTDKLGRLNLTVEGCKERDAFVLKQCNERNIPLQCSMGGGYSKDIKVIIEAHANTYRAAKTIYT